MSTWFFYIGTGCANNVLFFIFFLFSVLTSFLPSFIHPSIYSFIHSSIHSFIHSFVRSLVLSFPLSILPTSRPLSYPPPYIYIYIYMEEVATSSFTWMRSSGDLQATSSTLGFIVNIIISVIYIYVIFKNRAGELYRDLINIMLAIWDPIV